MADVEAVLLSYFTLGKVCTYRRSCVGKDNWTVTNGCMSGRLVIAPTTPSWCTICHASTSRSGWMHREGPLPENSRALYFWYFFASKLRKAIYRLMVVLGELPLLGTGNFSADFLFFLVFLFFPQLSLLKAPFSFFYRATVLRWNGRCNVLVWNRYITISVGDNLHNE